MNTAEIIFFVLAAITLISGILTVTTKNPIHSVLYLILTFFSISGHYILLNAQFLAVINIIVYAGAIMVLFLFVVMIMNLNKEDKSFGKPFVITAASLGSAIFLVLGLMIIKRSDITTNNQILSVGGDIGLTEELGKALFSDYVIPFELASILFMGAMVGSILLSKKTKREKKSKALN